MKSLKSIKNPELYTPLLLEINEDNMISLDEVLTSVGLGFYHYKILTMCGLFLLAEGGEAMLLSLVIGILQNEWGINDNEKSATITFTFAGLLFGSLCVGYISDLFGRKFASNYISFGLFLSGLLTVFAWNIYAFVAFRFFTGFFIGAITCLSSGIVAETLPMAYRA